MSKILLYISVFILCPFFVRAENEMPSEEECAKLLCGMPYNQKKDGENHGLYIEGGLDGFTIAHYNQGKKDDSEIWYTIPRDFRLNKYMLHSIVNYSNEALEDAIFIDFGVVRSVTDTYTPNRDFLREAKKLGFISNGVQFYSISFDRCGNIESEGWYIYDPERGDHPIIDPMEVGDWVYYDQNEFDAKSPCPPKTLQYNKGILKFVLDSPNLNQTKANKKDGLWIEPDSIGGTTTVTKYTLGKVDGQRIIYHTTNADSIAYNPYEIGFFDGDRPIYVHMSVECNVVRRVAKWFKPNVDFEDEAKALGFKGEGMQFYLRLYGPGGGKESEGWCIFDYEGGADMSSDSHFVGERIFYNPDGSVKEVRRFP